MLSCVSCFRGLKAGGIPYGVPVILLPDTVQGAVQFRAPLEYGVVEKGGAGVYIRDNVLDGKANEPKLMT